MRIPSVTEVIGFGNAAAFAHIPAARLEAAQDHGLDFHSLAAAYAQSLWLPEIPEDCQEEFESFTAWYDHVVVPPPVLPPAPPSVPGGLLIFDGSAPGGSSNAGAAGAAARRGLFPARRTGRHAHSCSACTAPEIPRFAGRYPGFGQADGHRHAHGVLSLRG